VITSSADAVAFGPTAVFGQVVCAEEFVEQRKVNREIHVDGLFLDAVVPVMEAGRDEEFLEAPELPAEVRVRESGEEIHDQHIGVHRALGEAQQDHRKDGGATQHEDFEEVHPRTSHPVHVLRGVMHRVEAPQRRDAMNQAMHPVLHEI